MAHQTRYWPLPHVTRWLPQETLYSLASRHHHASGNILPSQTSQQLFGHNRQGALHDIPSRIDEFVKRTEGALGDADDVIRQHSLLPFYFPYRSPAETKNAIAAVRTGGIASLKGRLGILASRFGASHPLKTCPQCVLEDQDFHQVAYWHMEHQWPGAWVCRHHKTPLHYALFKVNGEGRFHWCLPLDVKHLPGIDSRWFEESGDTVVRMTDCACALGLMPKNVHFSPSVLAATYKRRLWELDCFGPTGRLRSQELLRLLSGVCLPLSHVQGLGILSGDEVPLLNQFSRLVDEHRGVAHPLKHFVIVLALFDNWAAFLEAYKTTCFDHDRIKDETDFPLLRAFGNSLIGAQKVALVEAVKKGQSVTSASKTFKVAVATAMAWAAEAGIRTPKRAKFFTPIRRKDAIQLLQHGAAKEDAAREVGVSVQTITLLIRTEPGLRTAWNKAKFKFAQQQARASWAQTSLKLQPATGHVLRNLQPAVFAWLYRNDRSWLEDFNANLPRAARTNNSSIRWDVRDQQYSHAVESETLKLHLAQPDNRVRLADLCNRIPHLKARLSDLDQLPVTRAAIARATHRRTTD